MKTELPSQFDVHPEKFEYEYFTQSSIQKDIYAFAENTVEFLESLGECNVLFFDRSARTAYVVLDEYWNLKHDNDDDLPKPKFYFINPRGFKAYRSPSSRTLIFKKRLCAFFYSSFL